MNPKLTLPNPAQCWNAIDQRDPAMDGVFVYGVVTTGIYCRPSCPARTPKPENVRYFANTELAREASYRPCKRCKPDQVGTELSRLTEVAEHIRSHPDQRLALSDLARRAQMSSSHFQRRFVAHFGISPRQLQESVRMQRMKTALRAGSAVTEAGLDAGFGSSSRLYEPPGRRLGMSPRAYSRGGKGERIAYAIRHSGIGMLLMAATSKGVCSALLGEDEAMLLRQLREEFPQAEIVLSQAQQSAQLDLWIDALNAHLSEGSPSPDLPLDLRGTAFQIKVWRFLLGIPSGKAVSYSEVAAGVGNPQAVRAAASACAANRLAVLVPCHRVLRADGGLGGYRWGLERKRTLLQLERQR
ncbi:MAG: bifunctional DNA-binding transcriptional regulator/O6-methylguanine-DNA methyltransferase Ada [Xanthomonadales bacterium]|nr:bifunctional DNA-binding transcriptional regulator/O6-methylguanine-DNA methyltransferase Ada [Xanthomonadales bacterium]